MAEVDPTNDPRYTTCFVCNEQMQPMMMGPVVAWANDREPDESYNLWLVFGHPDCIRRVAHPDFDIERQRGQLG